MRPCAASFMKPGASCTADGTCSGEVATAATPLPTAPVTPPAASPHSPPVFTAPSAADENGLVHLPLNQSPTPEPKPLMPPTMPPVTAPAALPTPPVTAAVPAVMPLATLLI